MHRKSWQPGFFAIIVDTYVFFPITTPLQFPLHSRCRVRLICVRLERAAAGPKIVHALTLARLALARLPRSRLHAYATKLQTLHQTCLQCTVSSTYSMHTR